MTGSPVLLEPQLLSSGLASNLRQLDCLEDIQVDMLVKFNSRLELVKNNFSIHQCPPAHHFLSSHHPTLIFNLWV